MMVDLCMKFESDLTKNKSVSRLQGKVLRNHALTLARTHPPTHERPH